jgi:hypothetical protein
MPRSDQMGDQTEQGQYTENHRQIGQSEEGSP